MTHLINFYDQSHGLCARLVNPDRIPALIKAPPASTGYWLLTTGPYNCLLSMTRLALPSLRGMLCGSTSFTLTETVK